MASTVNTAVSRAAVLDAGGTVYRGRFDQGGVMLARGAGGRVIAVCALAAVVSCSAPPLSTSVAPAVSSSVGSTTGSNPESSSLTVAAGDLETSPPATVAMVPNGVYRVHLTVDELIAGGADAENAGTFTLTIAGGGYLLACVAEPDTSCGDTSPEHRQELEVGTVRGSGSTVWFVQDNVKKSRDTGCLLHSMATAGCGPDDPYRLSWTQTNGQLTLRDFFGTGDLAGQDVGYQDFTFKPWTKIA